MQTADLHNASVCLTPAVLRAAEGPLRETFVTGCEERGDGAVFLEVSPVGGRPLGAVRATLDLHVGERDLFVVGQVVSEADGRLRLQVTRDPKERPARPRRLRPSPDTMVAVFVPQGAGLGRYQLPVLDLGTRGLTLESTLPLEPGTVLRELVLVQRQRVIRRAEGTVVWATEVIRADGCRVFRCGVRLRQAGSGQLPQDPDLQELRDPARVRTILWALSDLGSELQLEGLGAQWRVRLAPARGSRDALPELKGRITPRLERREAAMEANASLFGSGYRFMVRVRAGAGDEVELHAAPVLREWHRRDEERCALPQLVGARVRFRHPVDGLACERRLADLSPEGFAFVPEPGDEDAFWPDLPLESVELSFEQMKLAPTTAVVRTSSRARCGVRIEGLSESLADALRARLLPSNYEGLVVHDGRDLAAVVALHRKVGLFFDEAESIMAAAPAETAAGWLAANSHPDGLMRTAIGLQGGEVAVTANIVRAYEATWLLQHNASASPTTPPNPGALQGALLGLILPRADGEYFCGMIAVGGPVFRMWQDFYQTTWNAEHLGSQSWTIWAASPGSASSSGGVTVRRLRGPDEILVERAALRLMNPICARSMSLVAGQIELPNCQRDWARGGLERGREAFGAFVSGRCAAILLHEWASPGLSLSGLLSAGYLLPVLEGIDGTHEALQALASLSRELKVPCEPPVRYLFALPRVGADILGAAGYGMPKPSVHLAGHRLGSRQYQRYIAARYGLLSARMRSVGRAA